MAKKTTTKNAPVSIETLIENKQLLTGRVEECIRESDGSESLVVEILSKYVPSKTRCIIKRDEADNNFKTGTVYYLVGLRVPLILIKNENGTLFGSRRQAQDILKENLRKDLENHSLMPGRILNFNKFGAFVAVNGVVGLLKNSDYSIDYSAVQEYLKVGDEVEVFCKELDEKDKIYWSVKNKVHRKNPIACDFAVGSVLLGKVVSLKELPSKSGVPYLCAFINVRQGIDVLCNIPYDLDIVEDMTVSVRIMSITENDNPYGSPKVSGRIERIV